MAATIEKTVEELGKLSVLELVELRKALEEAWDVTAAAPMAVAAAPGAGAAGGEAEAKDDFDVVIESVGDQKIKVIKAVREVTDLSLADAKKLVESAPAPLKEGVAKDEAEELKSKLEEAGATVELK